MKNRTTYKIVKLSCFKLVGFIVVIIWTKLPFFKKMIQLVMFYKEKHRYLDKLKNLPDYQEKA